MDSNLIYCSYLLFYSQLAFCSPGNTILGTHNTYCVFQVRRPSCQICNPPPAEIPVKVKKPFYTRWWFIAIVVVVALVVISNLINGSNNASTTTPQSSPQATPATADGAPSTATTAAEESTPAEAKQVDVPPDHKSALHKAETYSSTLHMSKVGIYNQLTSEVEQFTPEAAQYAVDNVKADWNANALAKAKTYQETMSMSPEAIRDQLTSQVEGFTEEEADYAITHLND